ncbi:copper resistance D family protein [Aestuariivita boseongensis]|uniref:copper resistance D family protein n=1 Tax=Aestuariivita boseongensis TaxID=1470562 RepID=UPI0006819FBA|nr:CopD family protein [Aestuariivita boseongensis]
MISDPWVWAAVLARTALYAGALVATGMVVMRLVFSGLLGGLDAPLRRRAGIFAALGILAALGAFSLRGAALTGDASGLTDPEMLGVLWQTPVGDVLIWQVAGLAAVLLGSLIGGVGLWLALAGGLAALWSFVLLGHVSDTGALALQVTLFLHLLAIAAWVGVLSPLAWLAGDAERRAQAAELGHRFGVAAIGFIAVLVVAGLWMALRLVGSVGALLGTGYGLVLLAKLGCVALLLGLGARNKVKHVPDLRAGHAGAGQALRRTIRAEWAVFWVIFLVTAVLTSAVTPP